MTGKKQKRVDIWMPLYINEYTGDTMAFTTEQHGAYLLLLMAAWKAKGLLPSDDESLASITRLPIERWEAMRAKILSKFEINGDLMTQKRVTHELARAYDVSFARSEAAKARAAKAQQEGQQKGSKRAANASANAQQKVSKSPANDPSKEQQNGTQSQSQSHTSTNVDGYISGGPPTKVSATYPPEFEEAWQTLPKRAGANPKGEAFKSWNARLKDGENPALLLEGAARYAVFCEQTGKTDTEFAMQAVRFFGTNKPYLEEWKPPPKVLTPQNARFAQRQATLSSLGTKPPQPPEKANGINPQDPVDVEARIVGERS